MKEATAEAVTVVAVSIRRPRSGKRHDDWPPALIHWMGAGMRMPIFVLVQWYETRRCLRFAVTHVPTVFWFLLTLPSLSRFARTNLSLEYIVWYIRRRCWFQGWGNTQPARCFLLGTFRPPTWEQAIGGGLLSIFFHNDACLHIRGGYTRIHPRSIDTGVCVDASEYENPVEGEYL